MSVSSSDDLPIQPISRLDEDNSRRANEQPLSATVADTQAPSPQQSNKIEQIRKACHDRNCANVISLAKTEGGLINDDVRREACMVSPV
jgi:hypothetical protein